MEKNVLISFFAVVIICFRNYNICLFLFFFSAWPAQLQELDNLKNFAFERGFDDELQLWDIPYWSRKQRRTLYNFKEEELREYFPLPQVLSGLFRLIERLFEVKFLERKTADVWHQDVRLFDVVNSNESEPIASFYFDPYARENDKIRGDENSGWMIGIRNRSSETQSNPLAALVFNFQPPSQGKPSLLSFKDLQLLFGKVIPSLLSNPSIQCLNFNTRLCNFRLATASSIY